MKTAVVQLQNELATGVCLRGICLPDVSVAVSAGIISESAGAGGDSLVYGERHSGSDGRAVERWVETIA